MHAYVHIFADSRGATKIATDEVATWAGLE